MFKSDCFLLLTIQKRLTVCCTLLCLFPVTVSKSFSQDQIARRYDPFPRMIAEFEPQRAILLSVSDLQSHHSHVLKQIVDASQNHAQILILYNNDQQLKKTVELFTNDRPENLSHVLFYKLDLDTIWLRDFGPRISQDINGSRALDFYYYGVRPFDDSFPERWALKTGSTMTKIPWTIQGGNLICNGQGTGITTTKIFEDNKVTLPGRSIAEGQHFLVNDMKKFCNLRELIVLKPLRNETTKHVDMFATFLSYNHILVARVDPSQDNLNAKILDENSRKLANVYVNGKPLQVSRIDIPHREGKAWSTYTNAIITDRLILVPTMTSDPVHLKQNAVKTYRELLPNHHVATIDISSMKKLQGSLHCMTLNLPAIAPLPADTITFSQAIERSSRIVANSNVQKSNVSQRYTIDKQLRRVFKSSTSDYLVDAYAVALASDVVSLLRASDRKLIRIRTSAVCEADRYWLQRNTNKIRENGARVQQYVLSLGN